MGNLYLMRTLLTILTVAALIGIGTPVSALTPTYCQTKPGVNQYRTQTVPATCLPPKPTGLTRTPVRK